MTRHATTTLRSITAAAKTAGACPIIDGAASLAQLAALYFSPQGQEFCRARSFPAAEQWQELAETFPAAELQARGLFIGHPCTGIDAVNPGNIAIIGKGVEATIYARGADTVQRISALCGARVNVIATNYAVVETYADATSQIILAADNTAIKL